MKKLILSAELKVPSFQTVISGRQKIVRKLSAEGKIEVLAGEKVVPEDVMAEGARVSGFRSIPLADSLEVPPGQALKYAKVALHDKVSPEQILATRRKLFREINIKSPLSGVVAEYNKQTGNLRIEFTTRREKLTAGCWGTVTKIFPKTGVEIETDLVKIIGVAGTGRPREGELKVLAKAEEFLLPEAINQDLTGKIIFGGARITKAALGKAVSLGLAGIVAGGINVEDFFQAGGGKAGPFWPSSDIGLTLVILEGFGLVPVDGAIYESLKSFDGHFAIIAGDDGELIIPQPIRAKTTKIVEVLRKNASEKVLQIGDNIRIIDPAKLGIRGKVLSISAKKQSLPIGLKNFLVEIETQSGKIIEHYNNLEVVI